MSTFAAVNTVDIPHDPQPNGEQITPNMDAFFPEMKEEDFIVACNNKIAAADSYWNSLKLAQRQEIGFKYWSGDQVNKSELSDDLEKGVDNIIFRNIETFIPIATSRPPEVSVTPTFKNEQTREYSGDVRRALQAEWEVYQNMQPLLGRAIRNHNMYFLAIFMYGYDPELDEFWTEEIPATDIKISKKGDFIARYIKNETLADIIHKFPSKKNEIYTYMGYSTLVEPAKQLMDSEVEYVEAWSNGTVVGWKLGTVCLGIKKNPHFDYTGRKVKITSGMIDPMTQQPLVVEKTVNYNHFKTPHAPFLFLTYWNRGIHIFDDTTLIEQAIGPQDWVNKRKRQIGMNADSTNGHWVSSGDFISKEEFGKITGGVNEKVWLDKGLPTDGLAKITGSPLPDYIFSDLADSRNAADNLMGTHSTTRGEKSGQATATQDLSTKDSDYGRVDGYVRDGVEQLSKKWFEAMYHMMLVYRLEDFSIAVPENTDTETDNVIFSRDRVPLIQKKNGDIIPVPIMMHVRQGSTMPRDEVTEAAKADKEKDILSPMDYFKKMGESNPRELTKNLLIWKTDPFALFPDDPDMQSLKIKMLQQKQAELDAQNMAKQTGAVIPANAEPPKPQMPAQPSQAMPGGDPNQPIAPGGGATAGGGPTDKGVGNALRAIMQENGVDPATMAAGASQ